MTETEKAKERLIRQIGALNEKRMALFASAKAKAEPIDAEIEALRRAVAILNGGADAGQS